MLPSISIADQRNIPIATDYIGSYETMMTWCRERDVYIDEKTVSIGNKKWRYTYNKNGSIVLGSDGPNLILKYDKNGDAYLYYSNPKKPNDPLNNREFKQCP